MANLIATLFLLFSLAQAFAVDIAGTVKSSTKKYATVITISKLIPVPGDKAQIFFKLPGANVDVSVASGHVYEVTGPDIMIEVEKATGTVAKDQLVKITSPNPKKKSDVQATASPSSSARTASSSPQPSSVAAPSGGNLVNLRSKIIGTWQGPEHRIQYFTDGSLVVDAAAGANQPRGHWRLKGDELITSSPSGNIRLYKIASVNDREIVLRDEKAQLLHLTRLSGSDSQQPATQSSSSTSVTQPPPPRDSVSLQQRLVGTWQGSRHRKEYHVDGTFVTDPHLVPNPPVTRWSINGDRVTEYYSGGKTITYRILSISGQEVVTTDDQGHTFQAKRIPDEQAAREKANW